jgi:hypothetical protein
MSYMLCRISINFIQAAATSHIITAEASVSDLLTGSNYSSYSLRRGNQMAEQDRDDDATESSPTDSETTGERAVGASAGAGTSSTGGATGGGTSDTSENAEASDISGNTAPTGGASDWDPRGGEGGGEVY